MRRTLMTRKRMKQTLNISSKKSTIAFIFREIRQQISYHILRDRTSITRAIKERNQSSLFKTFPQKS